METELEENLATKKRAYVEKGEKILSKNYRSGYSKKILKTQFEEVGVTTPR